MPLLLEFTGPSVRPHTAATHRRKQVGRTEMVVSTDSLKMGEPPGGYSYFGIAEGQPRIEFHDDPGQVILRYKVGTGYEQTKMLSVCYSPAGAALAFVEGGPRASRTRRRPRPA